MSMVESVLCLTGAEEDESGKSEVVVDACLNGDDEQVRHVSLLYSSCAVFFGLLIVVLNETYEIKNPDVFIRCSEVNALLSCILCKSVTENHKQPLSG